MPPPKQRSEEYYEHEYALRKLTAAVEVLTEQCEKNAEECRSNREEILVLKTRLGFVAAGAGLLSGGLVTAVVKLLTH